MCKSYLEPYPLLDVYLLYVSHTRPFALYLWLLIVRQQSLGGLCSTANSLLKAFDSSLCKLYLEPHLLLDVYLLHVSHTRPFALYLWLLIVRQ